MTKIKEILCVVVLCAFVAVLTQGTAISKKNAEEIFTEIKSTVYVKGISKQSKAQFKKETGFAQSEFESVVYYASDSVMEVREVMIIKLKNDSQADELVQKLKERANQKAELFKGYAAKQSAMLEKYVLEKRGGFVFFAVCNKPELAAAAFRKSL